MSRNLLPKLRSTPTPANIKPMPPGRWTRLDTPGELAKIEYDAGGDADLRTRIQSIPSPWARMLLFRAAFEDPKHPARKLAENELLDALEYTWSLGQLGAQLAVEHVRVDDLRTAARATGSKRAEDFAAALVELLPDRRGDGRGGDGAQPAMESITIAMAPNGPVFASSPYTLLFTAEDAAAVAPNSQGFFRVSGGTRARSLATRSEHFQRYVAQVILPQILIDRPNDANVDWDFVQRYVKPWLEAEVQACVANARTEIAKANLAIGPNTDWRAAAASLHLEAFDSQAIGGVMLYKQQPGAQLARSRWLLRSRQVGAAQAPLVVDRTAFDGRFYDNAPVVNLPADLKDVAQREVLPELGLRYPWVMPESDWLSDQLLLLNEPLALESVRGFDRASYRVHRPADDPVYAHPRMTLPLRGEFFRYFSPDDVERMLSVDVNANGSITVTLRLEVGPADEEPRELIVKRTYTDAEIRKDAGPGIAIWPSFQHPKWQDYVVFRRDASRQVAAYYQLDGLSAGKVLTSETEERTPTVRVSTFTQAPEVLELKRVEGGIGRGARSVGVIIPRYKPAPAVSQARWAVGVDFGTSNTVVSVRADGMEAARLFDAKDLILPLTEPAPETSALMEAYFFPATISPQPFGTAVVHLKRLPTLDLAKDRVGLRVNVPFSGHVDSFDTNAVVGDLKWSAEPDAFFLSSSFLRHLLATLLAGAIKQGVDPSRITIAWAYPRAFTDTQRHQLEGLWENVVKQFAGVGFAPSAVHEAIDESRSVLRHFFNAEQITVHGELTMLVDVGGGTTDIAAYEGGRTLLLDSVLLGGRNLTGRRVQAATERQLSNSFVEALVDWAKKHDLPEEPHRKAVQTYMEHKQVHLAFSYLVGTEWFRSHGMQFTPERAFQGFQGAVLYFFGALFYYLGLSLRALPRTDGGTGARLPQKVVLGGNGSRYLEWLTDLRPVKADDGFRQVLGALLAAGARVEGGGGNGVTRIELSDTPKQEVARGLVAKVNLTSLREESAIEASVVGESVTLQSAGTGDAKTLTATDRVTNDELIMPERVGTLKWAAGETEIGRFHRALVAEAKRLVSRGRHWTELVRRYETFFAAYGDKQVQEDAKGRLAYLAEAQRGFRGSLFVLEAGTVLDRLRDELVGGGR